MTTNGTTAKPPTVRTPWGRLTRVEEVTVSQRAGDDRFATVVQLLEADRGERFVRFAYTTDGVVRRGPVTLRGRDLDKLWAALDRSPALRAAILGEENGEGGSPKRR